MVNIRVPYRVQKFISDNKIRGIREWVEYEYKKVINTPPVERYDDAEVEVHSLLDHNFLFYYLVAIKSLVHFSKTKFSIYCHCCQPNMTEEDVAILKKHIKGVNYIGRDHADREMKKVLKPYKTCYEQRINNLAVIGTSGKFFDQLHFSKANKLVLLDADTLFLNTPTEIDEWALSNGKDSLHLKNIVNWYCIPYPQINEINGLPKVKPLFNAGLLCFDKRPLVENMGRVEEIMSIIDAAKGDFSGLDQTVFALMLSNQRQLPDSTYSCQANRRFSDNKDMIFKHYVGRNNRFGNSIYCNEGKQVMKQLMEEK